MNNPKQEAQVKANKTSKKGELSDHAKGLIKTCLENLKSPIITWKSQPCVSSQDLIEKFPELLDEFSTERAVTMAISKYIKPLGWTKRKQISIPGKRKKRFWINPSIRLSDEQIESRSVKAQSFTESVSPQPCQVITQPLNKLQNSSLENTEVREKSTDLNTLVQTHNALGLLTQNNNPDKDKEYYFDVTDVTGSPIKVGDLVGLSHTESSKKDWKRIIQMTDEYPLLEHFPAAKVLAIEATHNTDKIHIFVAIQWANGRQFFYIYDLKEQEMQNNSLCIEQLRKMSYRGIQWFYL